MGRKYPLLVLLWGLRKRRELSYGGALVENGLIVI